MLALRKERDITAWYRPTSPRSSVDVAADAYADAVRFFERELTNDEHKREWIRSHNSLADVCLVVQEAKRIYHTRSEKTKEVRQWLDVFASRVTYYGTVFDTLAQHHPEYVALAWGALKFILRGVITHAEMITELSRALTSIAEVLPRIRLEASLYPTDYMKDAISRVYAYIILFLQKAVKWYTMGAARRAVSSLFKPYSLSYKETVDQIKICTESVDAIASAALRAEARDINITVEEQGERLKETDKTLHDMQNQLLELHAASQRTEAQLLQMWQLATNHYDVTHAIKLDITDQKARICDIQFSGILEALGCSLTPESILRSCQSIAKRRHSWQLPGRESALFIQRLSHWASISGSSMFVVQVGPRAEDRAKDLAIDVITLLKCTDYTVFWHLSEPVKTNRACTLTDIFKNLIYHALRHDPKLVSGESRIGTITGFQIEHSLQEWLSLVCLVFSKISQCFVIVETEALYRESGRDGTVIRQLIESFQHILDSVSQAGNIMKLLIVSYGCEARALVSSGIIPRIVASINQSQPASRRRKQPFNHRAGTGLGRHHLQPRLVASQRVDVSTR